MKILQQPVRAKRNQIIQVHFDKPVIVRLISKGMFPRYKNGGKYVSQGGHYDQSPAKFTVPYDGVWHAVIEKGSHFNPLNVTGRVEILPPEIKKSVYFENEPEALETGSDFDVKENEADTVENEAEEQDEEVKDEFTDEADDDTDRDQDGEEDEEYREG